MRSFTFESNSKNVPPLVETEDFIPIPYSDEEEGLEADPDVYPSFKGFGAEYGAQMKDFAPRREGQPPLVRMGRKRSAAQMDEDISAAEYAGRKQRLSMEMRKTPWAADVDWDGCVNVSQMYVPLPLSF